jgi:DNA-binding transcriptional regulator GbsR (MarR family)
MAHPNGNDAPSYDDISSKEKGLYTQEEGVSQTDENLMVHRMNTNLTDTLESYSDVKKKVNPHNVEKGHTTAIDIPHSDATTDEKSEQLSQDSEEEVKEVSRLTLFYRRHLKWFQ